MKFLDKFVITTGIHKGDTGKYYGESTKYIFVYFCNEIICIKK